MEDKRILPDIETDRLRLRAIQTKQSKRLRPVDILRVSMVMMIIGMIAARGLYGCYRINLYFSLYVTFLTTFYHFAMRILVGEGVTYFYKHREFHYASAWYRIHKGEIRLYRVLKVKNWKLKLITAKPEQFDVRKRTYQELLHNMTQAEIGHEIMMGLSFVPLLFIIPYGAPLVFVTTSVIACVMDFLFVMIQRYNRPRVLKIKERAEGR